MAVTVANAARRNRPSLVGATAAGAPIFISFALTPTAAWATADQYKFCRQPKQSLPVDLVIDWPDMDSGAALVYDVGLYEDDTLTDTTVGTVVSTNCFIAASTAARAASTRERMANALQAAVAAAKAAVNTDRIVVATATTGGAGTGTVITGYFICRPKSYDD